MFGEEGAAVECRTLILELALAVDQGDWSRVGTLIADDFQFIRTHQSMTGSAALVAFLQQRLGCKPRRHLVMPAYFVKPAPDNLLVTSNWIAILGSGPDRQLLTGEYEDSFILTDKVWRFIKRVNRPDIP